MAKTYQDATRERLNGLTFPCHLIVYGPEREQRTTYRREHCGCFGESRVESMDEAVSFIDQQRYEGHLSEMTIFSCSGEVTDV